VNKIEKRTEYRRKYFTTPIRPNKRVCSEKLSFDSIGSKRSPGQLGKSPGIKKPELEGFEKIETERDVSKGRRKVNHRYLFYLLGLIEKDLKKDHYTTGQEDLILYDINGRLIGGF